MIVRSTQVLRQNPAYRSSANDATTSDRKNVGGCCVSPPLTSVSMMRLALRPIFISFLVTLGCSPASRTHPVPQAPTPATPAPVSGIQSPQLWSFNYEPGVTAYRIDRHATIESLASPLTSAVTDSSTNTSHEILSLERIGDTIQFALVVDTFATRIPERAGATEIPALPVQTKGWMTRDSLVIMRDSASLPCNSIAAVAESDVQNLLVRFPVELRTGMTWQDSVDVKGCSASIPTSVHITRSFWVAGESRSTEAGTLIIERTDSIKAHGEGAQQQHHVMLDAAGNGKALYYLGSNGQLMRVSSDQQLDLTVVTSENTGHFRQSLKQEIELIR